MKIIAIRQVYGDYGSLHAGQVGYIPDHLAVALIKRGLVRQAVDVVVAVQPVTPVEPVTPITPAPVPPKKAK